MHFADLHLEFTSHPTSPILLTHNSSLRHQKLQRPSHRRQNPAFQVVQEYFLSVSLIRNFMLPLTCFSGRSAASVTAAVSASHTNFLPQSKLQVAQTQLLRAQHFQMPHASSGSTSSAADSMKVSRRPRGKKLTEPM